MLGTGDWREQLNDYCPDSGLPMDDLISDLIAFGFDIDDLRHLERLSDPRITQAFPEEHLKFNVKEDVIRYMLRWADMIESRILNQISVVDVQRPIMEPVA